MPDIASAKRRRLEQTIFPLLKCVRCHGVDLRLDASAIHCRTCQQKYLVHESIPIMTFDPQAALNFDDSVIVSHPYSQEWLKLIEDAGGRWVLDLGAGNNPAQYGHVVKLDIFAVPHVDVVGVAEALPFRDGAFHTVMSGAVFEHVQNPFTSIDNVHRVLDPEGEVYIETAFLQPVHAFPNHYFNMTRAGLELLCSAFAPLRSGVQPHQAPSFMLRWVLQSWAAKLPAAEAADFLSATVEEIIEEYGKHVFSRRWLESFSPQDTEELAAGVYFHGRKRQRQAGAAGTTCTVTREKAEQPARRTRPTVDIELTNVCNASCVFCPRDKTPGQGFMDAATFAQAVERASESRPLSRVQLCGLGEPLLHPRVVEFVGQLSAAGLRPAITTNASRLTPALSQTLLEAGLKRIDFSASGIHDRYVRLHGLDFENTSRNIRDFAGLADKRCEMSISVVLHEQSPAEIRDIKTYWGEIGIRRVVVLSGSNRGGALDADGFLSAGDKFRGKARVLLHENNLDGLCETPFRFVFIGWNGNYYACCHDYRKRHPLGNVAAHSIRQINTIKRQLLTGGLKLCRPCDVDPLNCVRKVLFEIEAGKAPSSKLKSVLLELKARQDSLGDTVVKYEPVPPEKERPAMDRAA